MFIVVFCSFPHPPSISICSNYFDSCFISASFGFLLNLLSFSSPSLSALLLLSLSSSQHRESVIQLRPQLLPAPVVWQSQQGAATRLHQECLRAFHLFTMRRCVFSFLLRASASCLPKPLPCSHVIKCHLSSIHPTDRSQLGDQRDWRPCVTTPNNPQPTGLRCHPIKQ